MKHCALILIALTSLSVSKVFADDDTFDVPNGMFSTFYSGALVPNTVVYCDFSIEEPYYGERWVPMVALVFAGDEDPDSDAPYFRLSATRSNLNPEEGWRHEFEIYHGNDRETAIAPHVGKSDFTSSMTMMLNDEGYVFFYLGEKAEEASRVDASDFDLTLWRVNVSGVRGSGDCDSTLLGVDEDEDEYDDEQIASANR